jgi:hypothetical protein
MSDSHTSIMLEFSRAADSNSQIELLERKLDALEKKTKELEVLVKQYQVIIAAQHVDNALPVSFDKPH